ncbi:MAG: NAD(+) synthase [Bdellovibrionaceae bacterium]|nr:NAD(+) synthase [Pseudobdellovibrionaceae bacterium]MDW8190799.1 NAD(+) synthase [Pseudobdellovibrionaceae bacterium]
MYLVLAQLNSWVGDWEGNRKKIQDVLQQVTNALDSGKNSVLIVFPEGMLSGYPWHDLVEVMCSPKCFKKQISQLKAKLRYFPHVGLIFGSIIPYNFKSSRPFLNAAVFLSKNKCQIVTKSALPTYDVFNEDRWFQKGKLDNNIISWGGFRFLVTICEDIWRWGQHEENMLTSVDDTFDVVLNLSGSPFTHTKERQREHVIRKTVSYFGKPLVYCNRVGAEDELIFDGKSLVMLPYQKKVWDQLPSFREQVTIYHVTGSKGKWEWEKINSVALNEQSPKFHSLGLERLKLNNDAGISGIAVSQRPGGKNRKSQTKGKHPCLIEFNPEEVRQALLVGLGEFVKKNGFHQVHLGVSGGIDSALVLALACDALGSERVTAIMLPSRFTSNDSLRLAQELGTRNGVRILEFSIESLFQHLEDGLAAAWSVQEFSLVHENIQSRLRALVLMAYANHYHSLLLATSNKSELATGYGTIYGDMAGGLLPIGDLWKTQVYELAQIYVTEGKIPREIFLRPPTAELRLHQKDQDVLPPYEELDKYFMAFLEKGCRGVGRKLPSWTFSFIKNSEFKRWQAPPILKVSDRAFGRGRHWPLGYHPRALA